MGIPYRIVTFVINTRGDSIRRTVELPGHSVHGIGYDTNSRIPARGFFDSTIPKDFANRSTRSGRCAQEGTRGFDGTRHREPFRRRGDGAARVRGWPERAARSAALTHLSSSCTRTNIARFVLWSGNLRQKFSSHSKMRSCSTPSTTSRFPLSTQRLYDVR